MILWPPSQSEAHLLILMELRGIRKALELRNIKRKKVTKKKIKKI